MHDLLPRDRMVTIFEAAEFPALQDDIEDNGQNDAITVHRAPGGSPNVGFQVAVGRRRLETPAPA